MNQASFVCFCLYLPLINDFDSIPAGTTFIFYFEIDSSLAKNFKQLAINGQYFRLQ